MPKLSATEPFLHPGAQVVNSTLGAWVEIGEGARIGAPDCPVPAQENIWLNGHAPVSADRYNLYRSAQINASAAPGYSSVQVMRALEAVFAETMPVEMQNVDRR